MMKIIIFVETHFCVKICIDKVQKSSVYMKFLVFDCIYM